MFRIVLGLAVLVVGCGANTGVTGRSGSNRTEQEATAPGRSQLPREYVKPSPWEFAENCWWLTYNDVDHMIIGCADEARSGVTYDSQREILDRTYPGCVAEGKDPDFCWDFSVCLSAIADAVYHQ